MDSKLKILGELLIEFLIVLLVLLDFSEHLKAFLDNIFLNNLKNFVLLQGFSGNIQRKIFRINYSLNES